VRARYPPQLQALLLVVEHLGEAAFDGFYRNRSMAVFSPGDRRVDTRAAFESALDPGRVVGPGTIIRTATGVRTTAMDALTVPTSEIATTVAAHGGRTFQTNIFSTANTAFDVAVMRLASVPGIRSAKYPGAWPVKWSVNRTAIITENSKLSCARQGKSPEALAFYYV
jgi:hypothetical protein